MEKPNQFNLKTSLTYILANEDIVNKDEILPYKEKNRRNIFDRLMFDIHKQFHIKDKIGRGKAFELFCIEWLKAQNEYKKIWLWKDVPEEFRKKMGIKKKKAKKSINKYKNIGNVDKIKEEQIKKKDIGIDIIVEDYEGDYSAIQCKYKNPIDGRPVCYDDLKTFLTLCKESLIPFKKEILMTDVYQYGGQFNNELVMKKHQKVINSTLFRKTPRTIWEIMAGYTVGYISGTVSGSIPSGRKETEKVKEIAEGNEKEEIDEEKFPGIGHKFDDSDNEEIETPKKIKRIKKPKIPGKGIKLSNNKKKPKTIEELKEKRLKALDNLTP
jgi:hypothetical protein